MKINEIHNFMDAYNELKDTKMSIKATYALVKLSKWCEEQNKFYIDTVNKILQECAEVDEKGNFVYTDESKRNYKLKPEFAKEAESRFQDLVDLDYTNAPLLDMAMFDNLEIDPSTFSKLFAFIVE